MKPEILFLSHCAPTIPDKGERIRAYHEVQYLSKRYRVHVAAFTRDELGFKMAESVRSVCASLYLERVQRVSPIAKGIHLLLGGSLSGSFYHSRGLRAYVRQLSRTVRFAATVAFSSVMEPYAPDGVPLLMDMVDVDSEKWREYSRVRSPHWLFRVEAGRMQAEERRVCRRAKSVLLTTEQECALLRRMSPDCRIRAVGNGVDLSYFDPAGSPSLPGLAGKRYIVMVGAMGYYPNSDGAVWFANEVFPGLREKIPAIEFFIVGHKPPPAVERLGSAPGISVTGYVPDVRPYIAQAVASVTPLRIARGVQNKVLEALAMGKPVLASPEIGRTFAGSLPVGLRVCPAVEDYHDGAIDALRNGSGFNPKIRQAAVDCFSWERTLHDFDQELQAVIGSRVGTSV